MKERIKLCALLVLLFIQFGFCLSAQAVDLNQPSGTISVLGNMYVNNMNNTWNINVSNLKPVRISYTIDVENNYDLVKIWAVNADNTISTAPVATLSGKINGSISTVIPTGKVKIEFTTNGSVSYASGYNGINLEFSTDYSTTTYSSENSIINGNLGIGTLTPTSRLHLLSTSLSGTAANINLTQTQANPSDMSDLGLGLTYSLRATSSVNELAFIGAKIRTNNYLTGGGVVNYQRVLNLASGSAAGSTTTNLEMIRMETGTSTGVTTNAYGLHIVQLPGTNKWGIYDESGSKWFTSGKVGIGCNPQHALDVKGTIRAAEIIVSVFETADFVFEPQYKLPKLTDVHDFIQKNGHLPNIPSAAEVKENGISLADMQVKLLQKVEELTLYVIDQQKEIENLKNALSNKERNSK